MRRRPVRPLAGLLVSLSLVAAACGGGQKSGGNVVLGAEQWPACLNPITTCAEQAWLGWAVLEHVLPKAMTLDANGSYVASPVLTEAPTVENGGIKEDPFTVTFKIAANAVWDDGMPITSEDIAFTWQAWMKTKGTISTHGYDLIDEIDTEDLREAVVRFKDSFVAWPELFGSNAGYILKKAAFAGKTDLAKQMTNDIGFSGGPWRLKSFTKQQAILTPNTKFWGTKPQFEQVTVVPREKATTALTQLEGGQLHALYPTPSTDLRARVQGNRDIKLMIGGGVEYDGIYFNTEAELLDDVKIREGVARALAREAVLAATVGKLNPDAKVLNCAGWVPTVGEWCDETDYADITYDADAAKGIFKAEGWELNEEGIFEKDGETLTLELLTDDKPTHEDALAIFKQKAKDAGIDLKVDSLPQGDLIGTRMLPGEFQLVLIGLSATPDPTVSSLYGCDQIPTKKNDLSGMNIMRWCNQKASRDAYQADLEPDPKERLRLIRRIGDAVRKDLPWLPLYQNVLVTVWRSDLIGGPVGAYTSSPLGGFANVEEWIPV